MAHPPSRHLLQPSSIASTCFLVLQRLRSTHPYVSCPLPFELRYRWRGAAAGLADVFPGSFSVVYFLILPSRDRLNIWDLANSVNLISARLMTPSGLWYCVAFRILFLFSALTGSSRSPSNLIYLFNSRVLKAMICRSLEICAAWDAPVRAIPRLFWARVLYFPISDGSVQMQLTFFFPGLCDCYGRTVIWSRALLLARAFFPAVLCGPPLRLYAGMGITARNGRFVASFPCLYRSLLSLSGLV